MASPATSAIGEAIYIRTDVPGYEEENIPFQSLEEMIGICTASYPDKTLEKIIVYGSQGDELMSLTLDYISSTRGRPMPEAQVESLPEGEMRGR